MAKATRSAARGVKRGMYVGLTGDASNLRKMRREVQERDTVAEAWSSVDREINRARREIYTGLRTIQER